MTEPYSEIVTVHGLISGIGIGELNKDMWEPLPNEPLVEVPSPEMSVVPSAGQPTTRL